jgi:hypothetical protein
MQTISRIVFNVSQDFRQIEKEKKSRNEIGLLVRVAVKQRLAN